MVYSGFCLFNPELTPLVSYLVVVMYGNKCQLYHEEESPDCLVARYYVDLLEAGLVPPGVKISYMKTRKCDGK